MSNVECQCGEKVTEENKDNVYDDRVFCDDCWNEMTACTGCGQEINVISVRTLHLDSGTYCQCCQENLNDEEEDGVECECCNEEYPDERIVGCCQGCEHAIENMCNKCGVWDESEQCWYCPDCAEKHSVCNTDDEDEEDNKIKMVMPCIEVC